MEFVENKILPVLLKVGNNKRLTAIRNGISISIPFTIVGSIFLIIGNFPVKAWTDLIAPWSNLLNGVVNVTFGALGLIAAIGIGYYMAKELDVDPISNTIITTIAFLLANLNEDLSLNTSAMDATGMFTAIVIGLFATQIFKFFVDKNIVIKMPQGVPPSVSMSFASLIPAAVVITIIWILRCILGINLNEIIKIVFSPLTIGLGSLPGLMVYTLIVCLLWVCGIHGDNILSGIATPIFLTYLAQNTAAFQKGLPAPHIIADGFWILFMCLGGTGATLGLVLNMIRSKAKMYNSLGKMALPSAIFCINEPVIFGFPIVMNPIMMIPFILTPMILGTVTYFLMSVGIVGKLVFQVPWTIPPIIGPYLATNGSIGAAIWSVISIVLSYLIYMPFFKIVEKGQLAQEKNELESKTEINKN